MLDHITKQNILCHLQHARCSFRQQFRVFTCQLMSKQNTIPHVKKRGVVVIGKEGWLYFFFWCDYTNFHLCTLKLYGVETSLFFCHQSAKLHLPNSVFWCLPFLYTNQSSFKMTTLNTFPSGLIWLPLWRLPRAGQRQPPCSSGSEWRG